MSNQPNIIIYHSHDTGRWIGPYNPSVSTPHADRFAREGIVFDQAFSASPTCSPSRAALMTGRYPHANGVMGLCHKRFRFDLNPGERHAASYFNELGYHTAAIGVVHEVRDPDGKQAPYHTRVNENNALKVGQELDKILSSYGDDKPMFISVGTSQTHRPYPKLANGEKSSCQLPPFIPDTDQTRHDFAELDASLEQWDRGLGDVLETLCRRGLEDNSLVIVTTDHGLAMPRSKGTLYDSGTGILMMMRWPGRIAAEQRCSEMVSNVDILPTLLEAAGAIVPDSCHGQSLLPLFRATGTFERPYLFTEHTFHGLYSPMRAVRTDRYKYILNFFTGQHIRTPTDGSQDGAFSAWEKQTRRGLAPLHELYDLKNDPDEQRNLLIEPDEKTKAIAQSLRAPIKEWMTSTNDPLLKGPIPSPAEQQARDLLVNR